MRKTIEVFLLNIIICWPNRFAIWFVFVLIHFFHPYVSILPGKVTHLIKKCILFPPESLMLSSTGCLIIFRENLVIKIPLCKYSIKSLAKEYSNYCSIKKSCFSKITDYHLIKNMEYGYVYYEMSRLEAHSWDENHGVDLILAVLKNCPGDECSFYDIPEQHLGLKILIKHAPKQCQQKLIHMAAVLAKNTCQAVPMHGDLTPLNIMFSSGKPVIVDLDRFEFQGLPFIDEIHYRIEKEAKINKWNSYKQFKELCETSINSDFSYSPLKLASYIYFRVGAEHREGYKNSRAYYKRAVSISLFLADAISAAGRK
ncbi:hypothetical protein ACFL9U_07445 [Thermodesulfobacteriota bacterium]